jgi:hypothetical protein
MSKGVVEETNAQDLAPMLNQSADSGVAPVQWWDRDVFRSPAQGTR